VKLLLTVRVVPSVLWHNVIHYHLLNVYVKNIKTLVISIYNESYDILFADIEGGTQAEGVGEQGVGESIWT
jgi:hypothetical protein